MYDHQFIVASGGTGAKVVEALIHLCGAGLGPKNIDILLLDVDESNGNVGRTRETAGLYARLSSYDWAIEDLNFFGTDIKLHRGVTKIKSVSDGGLRRAFAAEEGASAALDLLYDKSEQEEGCRKGFLAKPNMGSLILGEHLRECLEEMEEGRRFIDTLARVLDSGPSEKVPLTVLGSVFGGTGASTFPIACHRIRQALGRGGDSEAARKKMSDARWDYVQANALLLMPYFQPDSFRVDSVDPSRFFLDTRNALMHYEKSGGLRDFDSVYLVGSNDSKRNSVRYEDGAKDQANRSFLEEIVAACGVLDFGEQGRLGVHIYEPREAEFGWSELPCGAGLSRRQAIACFLQLGAFAIRPKTTGKLSGGLIAALRDWKSKDEEMELFPFFEELIGNWIRERYDSKLGKKLKRGDLMRLATDSGALEDREVAINDLLPAFENYFFRLLVWAETAFSAHAEGDVLLSPVAGGDSLAIWEVMCTLRADVGESPSFDNALVRFARLAAAAIKRIGVSDVDHNESLFYTSEDSGGQFAGFPGRGERAEREGAFNLLVHFHELEAIGLDSPNIREDVISEYRATSKVL